MYGAGMGFIKGDCQTPGSPALQRRDTGTSWSRAKQSHKPETEGDRSWESAVPPGMRLSVILASGSPLPQHTHTHSFSWDTQFQLGTDHRLCFTATLLFSQLVLGLRYWILLTGVPTLDQVGMPLYLFPAPAIYCWGCGPSEEQHPTFRHANWVCPHSPEQ